MPSTEPQSDRRPAAAPSLMMSGRRQRWTRWKERLGRSLLFLVASVSTLAVVFIVYYIAREAFPFFRTGHVGEFFASTRWYPSREPPEFGVLAILVGSGLVTLGAIVVAVPLGLAASICLSDVLPFGLRQVVKPVIEILAAIPSVAYGFFALVVLAPLLQERGGHLLSIAAWMVGAPVVALAAVVLGDLAAGRLRGRRTAARAIVTLALLAAGGAAVWLLARRVGGVAIDSGTNALNVSIVLGIMALPTVVSVSEDALQAVGRELREGSYACGATRAETLLRVVLPAASSGLMAAVILGIMRAIGETMVVWMASGNAAQIPRPWFNALLPVRTLTATIAGDMGEADQVTGSTRYSVLFAMALVLLVISLFMNTASEVAVRRTRRKLRA